MNRFAEVVCPSCFEAFPLALPDAGEVPCELDYDCEVCCSPMVVVCRMEAGAVTAEAQGLG
jgi:hypothetical protein